MEYQVALLDNLNVYQVFFKSENYNDIEAYYNEQLNNNFIGVYSLEPNTSQSIYLIERIFVSEMNEAQSFNINTLSPWCTQYCIIVSFL
jgi:hypothetical protein